MVLQKQVGLYNVHVYSRSLALFAANLGSIGWAVAAKKIENVLPPGAKFGRGWVGDGEATQRQHCQLPLLSAFPPHSSSSEPMSLAVRLHLEVVNSPRRWSQLLMIWFPKEAIWTELIRPPLHLLPPIGLR